MVSGAIRKSAVFSSDDLSLKVGPDTLYPTVTEVVSVETPGDPNTWASDWDYYGDKEYFWELRSLVVCHEDDSEEVLNPIEAGLRYPDIFERIQDKLNESKKV